MSARKQLTPKTAQFSPEWHEFPFSGTIVHFSYCTALGKQSLIDRYFLLPSVILIVKAMVIFMKSNIPCFRIAFAFIEEPNEGFWQCHRFYWISFDSCGKCMLLFFFWRMGTPWFSQLGEIIFSPEYIHHSYNFALLQFGWGLKKIMFPKKYLWPD